MKKLFLISILFIVVIKLSAQDFAPIGATWYYDERFAFNGDIDYIKYTAEKDTLIHGEICRKIVKRHDLFCYGRPETEFLFSRNDTVFFLDTLFNEFQILYDFNTLVNDSWIIKIMDETQDIDTILVTVDSISKKHINGFDLKALNVTYHKFDENRPETYPSVIIEKIGDIHFMFNWYRWSKIACDANYSNGLRCYQEAELGLYSTEIVDSCDYYYKWVGVDEIDNIKTFKIFPNPSNGQFQIDVEPDKNKTIEISNLKGEIIYSKAYNSKTVDMTGYLKGIYVVRLKSGEKTVGIGRIILEGK